MNKTTMDFRNVSNRSEVMTWGPDALADYFKMINFKDCEDVVRKYNISGPRFLSMAENNFQKFPKLRVPLLSKLCQEINKKEERRSLFSRKMPVHKIPEEKEFKQDDDGWSSFEEDDDYESPTEDQDFEEDEGDYESPTEVPVEDGSDNLDYEPPPTNNEEAHSNVIFSASIPSNSGYIDRLTTVSSSQHPPLPPQRHGPTLLPPVAGVRNTPFQPPLQNNEVISGRSMRHSKPPAPIVDRTKKPPFVHPGAQNAEKDYTMQGKKLPFSEMPIALPPRPPMDHSTRIQRPPPPTERINAVAERKPTRSIWQGNRITEEDGPQKPLPQPVSSHYSSNTFPSSRVNKIVLGAPASRANTESMHSSGSLPPRFHSSNISRSFSEGPANFRPPIPAPSIHMMSSTPVDKDECLPQQKWYTGEVNRPEAEEALMKINQDGTFLVRDSSKRSVSHPFVLMVLYKNKVYNIQIRYDEREDIYLLGTGLRGKENFSSVADMIEHFRRTPLLLIDGKDRGSKNQCMLTYAAAENV
ncbi:lymphocyte cytosolic protein 2 isoform X2 [Rhinatrema bivittatum]|uniref:lymphocyte cytosolic protein 2 isoform X2 n=1 Tax=Rhinatrema bivittatum TaxID=194408 RepID=UPI00112D4867|nr:lymphocyte cytosolic protein 2 isoform X2 [Rhinatrema bivittatum]